MTSGGVGFRRLFWLFEDTASVDGYGQKRRRVWRQARVVVIALFVEAQCFVPFAA